MDKIIIEGNGPLKGEVKISGAKNAALPMFAATLLAPGKSMLENVPDLMDTRTIAKLVEVLGAQVKKNDSSTYTLDCSDLKNHEAPYSLVKTMRASCLVLGPLLARLGRAKVSLPGGCAIGARPMDIHVTALEAMGATIELKDGRRLDTGEIRFARGNAKLPLKDEALKAKFLDCASGAGDLDAAALYERLNRLGELESLRDLVSPSP